MNKSDIRIEMSNLRNALSTDDVFRLSNLIIERIEQHPIFRSSKTIGIFYPFRNEVNLLPLLVSNKKVFCFPKITNYSQHRMDFYHPTDGFKKSKMGICEPIGKKIEKDDIDLILLPGLAFSSSGARIGYGKGYYDLYLKDFKNQTMGVCYSFQLYKELPYDPHDFMIHGVITEKENVCIQQ